jgi:hypothetical protein
MKIKKVKRRSQIFTFALRNLFVSEKDILHDIGNRVALPTDLENCQYKVTERDVSMADIYRNNC